MYWSSPQAVLDTHADVHTSTHAGALSENTAESENQIIYMTATR